MAKIFDNQKKKKIDFYRFNLPFYQSKLINNETDIYRKS